MDVPYPFDFPGLGSMIQGAVIIFCVLVGVFALAFWVMQCIGFMRMAKKVGFPDPWLAWIPGAGDYLFVKLAGQKRRKIGIAYMFLLYLGFPIVLGLFWIGCVSFIAWLVPYIMNQVLVGNWYDPPFVNGLPGGFAPMGMSVGSLVLFILCGLALMAIGIVVAVFYYIMLYHVFKRFKPNLAVVFLVLSIVFNFLAPIFILVSSFGTPDEKEGETPPPAPVPPSQQPPSFSPPGGY